MPLRKRIMPTATFPQRLRAMMANNNINQSDVARQVGYTPTAVWNWLQGNTLPRPETLTALSNLFNVTEDWLRDGDASVVAHDTIRDEHDTIRDEFDDDPETITEKINRLRAEIAAATGCEVSRVRLILEFGPN